MRIYLLILIIFASLTVSAEFDLEWEAYTGGENAESANALCRLSDGSFVAAGYTASVEGNNTDIYLVCCDAAGNEIWNHSYGSSGWEYARGICTALDDDGIVVCGLTTAGENEGFDIFILKTDILGNEEWLRTYGGDGFDTAEALCRTNDGYLLCGYTDSRGLGEDDIYVLRTDVWGDTLWTQTYGSANSDSGNGIIALSDGSYLITGSTGEFDQPWAGSSGRNREIELLKIDGDGNVLAENSYWTMNTHQNSYDLGNAVCACNDGGFYVIGSTSQHLGELMDAALIKVDSELNHVWKRHLEFNGFYDYGYDICEDAQTGNVFICGSANQSQAHDYRAFVAVVDSNGIRLDYELFEGNGSGNALFRDDQGFLTIAGYGRQDTEENSDLKIFQLSYQQNPAEENDLAETCIKIYNHPNPFNPSTTISFDLPADELPSASFSIYNVKGQLVKHFGNLQDNQLVWDGRNQQNISVSAGIYLGCLSYEDKIITRKMALIK
ncbi:MAG: T9SS type A sorting domain-containing protein [Candidatus Cloacimonetes bacterium]|nr:T9SS type A sorting domain-containing protein [Candidatus Cloacimonadota bacterium]